MLTRAHICARTYQLSEIFLVDDGGYARLDGSLDLASLIYMYAYACHIYMHIYNHYILYVRVYIYISDSTLYAPSRMKPSRARMNTHMHTFTTNCTFAHACMHT